MMTRMMTVMATALTLAPAAFAQEASEAAMIDRAGWFEDPARLTQTGGKQVYEAICAACHMPEGEGAGGAGDYRRWPATITC